VWRGEQVRAKNIYSGQVDADLHLRNSLSTPVVSGQVQLSRGMAYLSQESMGTPTPAGGHSSATDSDKSTTGIKGIKVPGAPSATRAAAAAAEKVEAAAAAAAARARAPQPANQVGLCVPATHQAHRSLSAPVLVSHAPTHATSAFPLYGSEHDAVTGAECVTFEVSERRSIGIAFAAPPAHRRTLGVPAAHRAHRRL